MTQRAQEPEAARNQHTEPIDAPSGDSGQQAVTEPIRQYGDPVLRAKARPIRTINAAIRELAKRMADVMYAVDGVGLAAPQIGESRRIVVYDTGEGLTTLINPRIATAEGAESDVEACLSVRGLCGDVERYQRVRVKALGLDGKEITIDGEGYLARVLQHELDHLDGILYTDRALAVRASCSEPDDDEDEDAAEDEGVDALPEEDRNAPPAIPGDPR